MRPEQLAAFSETAFYVSLVLFAIGLILTALSFWRLNIREVYLIRSGKARRKSIGQLEAHNRETGKLRDTLDLDYTTGTLKKTSKKLARKSEKTSADTPLIPEIHSGNTGAFQNHEPMPAAASTSSSEPASDNSYAGVTMQLDTTAIDYESRMDAVYEKVVTGELAVTESAPVGLPFTILSNELIIHTDEVIEI